MLVEDLREAPNETCHKRLRARGHPWSNRSIVLLRCYSCRRLFNILHTQLFRESFFRNHGEQHDRLEAALKEHAKGLTTGLRIKKADDA